MDQPFGSESYQRLGRSALPSFKKGFLSDSLRESPQKIGIADRPEAGVQLSEKKLKKV
jgi:hypothetical protein